MRHNLGKVRKDTILMKTTLEASILPLSLQFENYVRKRAEFHNDSLAGYPATHDLVAIN